MKNASRSYDLERIDIVNVSSMIDVNFDGQYHDYVVKGFTRFNVIIPSHELWDDERLKWAFFNFREKDDYWHDVLAHPETTLAKKWVLIKGTMTDIERSFTRVNGKDTLTMIRVAFNLTLVPDKWNNDEPHYHLTPRDFMFAAGLCDDLRF